jgi:hypothetical protein
MDADEWLPAWETVQGIFVLKNQIIDNGQNLPPVVWKACLQIFKQTGVLSYTIKKIGGTIKFAGIPGKGRNPFFRDFCLGR